MKCTELTQKRQKINTIIFIHNLKILTRLIYLSNVLTIRSLKLFKNLLRQNVHENW